MDKDVFFRKATLLICSSLDIEVALSRCRSYISQYLPADKIYLNIYEPGQGQLRYVAKADANGVFTYAAPRAGWWGFAALNGADFKITHDGQERDVELGAVIWVKFENWVQK